MNITNGNPYKRSSGSAGARWGAPYHIDGRRKVAYGRVRAEAVTKRDEAIARLTAGAPSHDSRQTVRRFCETWEAVTLAASDRKPTTKALYAGTLRRHILPAIGDLPLAVVTTVDVDRMLLGIGSASTARTARSVISAVFSSAVAAGLLASSPVRDASVPRPKRTEAEHLDHEQVATLVEAAAGHELAALWLLVLATGVRRGEALGLHWSDVDLGAGTVAIRRTVSRVEGVGLVVTEPKWRSRRTLAIGGELVAALKRQRTAQIQTRLIAGRHWTEQDIVFTNSVGGYLEPRNALRIFQVMTTAAGLGKVKLHSLRHTAATMLLSTGHDVAVVGEQLGHSSPTITLSVYAHVLPERRRSAAATLDALLTGSRSSSV